MDATLPGFAPSGTQDDALDAQNARRVRDGLPVIAGRRW